MVAAKLGPKSKKEAVRSSVTPDSYVKKKKREEKVQGIKNKENNKNKDVFRFIQSSFRKTFSQ